MNHSNYFWGFPDMEEDYFEKEKKKVAMNLLQRDESFKEKKPFKEFITLKSLDL